MGQTGEIGEYRGCAGLGGLCQRTHSWSSEPTQGPVARRQDREDAAQQKEDQCPVLLFPSLPPRGHGGSRVRQERLSCHGALTEPPKSVQSLARMVSGLLMRLFFVATGESRSHRGFWRRKRISRRRCILRISLSLSDDN